MDLEIPSIASSIKEHLAPHSASQIDVYDMAVLIEVLAKASSINSEQVAVALTKDDVVRAHARDELGIDIDELANPWQVHLFDSFINVQTFQFS